MSLSSLIVQRGVATMRQVEEALARQVIYGGDLATNLLEVARIDESALGGLVAESMRLPPAPSGELPVVTGPARQLLPEGIASQRAIVPLALEGTKLVLAVAEAVPADLEQELAFALGVEIEQRAALAVRVRQAISRVYRTPLERRMQRLVAQLSGEPVPVGSMPPPLGAAPAVPRPDTQAPPAFSSTVPGAAPAFPSMPRRQTARSFPKAPSDKPAAAAPPAGAAFAPTESPSEKAVGLLERKAAPTARPTRRRRGPLTIEQAKSEAEEATDRDALLDLYFDFTRQFFDFAALFLVHGDIAEGRDAFGVGATRERVVGIGVPLDLSGLMASAREKRAPIIDKAPPDGVDAVLLADLLRSKDSEIAIVPLVVRTRAVALLLGDCGEAGIDRGTLQQIVAFAGIIGKAFERLIVRRKLDGFIAGSNTATAGRVDARQVPPVKRPSIVPASTVPLDPPPRANVASLRPIGGPPIPREDPDSQPVPVVTPAAPPVEAAPSPTPPPVELARNSPPEPVVEAHAMDDDAAAAAAKAPSAPPSAAISAAPHLPPPPRGSQSPALPSVIVADTDPEVGAVVEKLVGGAVDEAAEGELLRKGERAMRSLIQRFPGPVTVDRARFATASPMSLPRASECGIVLRLIARQRKVALPFVMEKLGAPEADVRGWATHLIAELPYLEALPDLLLRLRDPDAGVRRSAVYAVASIGRTFPTETRDALMSLARSLDPADRSAALEAMGALREPVVVPELVRALADGHEAAVQAAHDGLVQVTRQDFGMDARPWLRWWDQNSGRHRIEWLIDALTHEVSEIRRSAGEELRATSKEYFGYSADLGARDRERAQQRYRDWWITEGKTRFRR
jgi:hypothetical protein